MDPLLMVLDGNNLVLRAYHSQRYRNKDGEWEGLATSDGRPSGALYGTLVMFARLVREFNPTHVLFTFDHGRSKARLDIRPEYKANRDSSTSQREDLKPQYGAIEKLLSTLDVRHYREQGVEADDLIANAVYRWREEMPIVIVSADHDLLQLVDHRVKVLKPGMGGNSKEVLYTKEKIEEEYGFTPKRLSEVWALCGDSGDNVAGIPRVGYKTAAKIMSGYDSLNEAIAYHPKIEGYEKQVMENYQLIHLDGNFANLHVDLEECVFNKEFDEKSVRAFLESWEFKSQLKRMDEGRFW